MKRRISVFVLTALLALGATAANAQFAPNANDVNPLKIGQNVPDLTISNGEGVSKSLSAIIGGKPTVLMFYRGDWCGNCITHFKDEIVPLLPRINSLGYNVAFIGPDDAAHIRTTAEKVAAPSSMIWSDSDGALSVAMGIAWQQQERMLERLAEYSGGKNKGFVPVISTFVVDGEGKIIFEDIRPSAIPAAARIPGKLLMGVLENLK
jgi:peroxiredoxin